MSDRPQKTPLVDLLRNVPKDLRAEWPIQWSEDGRETGHSMSPIGKHCHEAADRIAELKRQLAEALETISGIPQLCRNYESQLAEAQKLPDLNLGTGSYASGWNDCLAWIRQARKKDD